MNGPDFDVEHICSLTKFVFGRHDASHRRCVHMNGRNFDVKRDLLNHAMRCEEARRIAPALNRPEAKMRQRRSSTHSDAASLNQMAIA